MAPPCSCRCQVAVAVVGHLPYLSAESMGLTVSQPPSVVPSKFNVSWKKRSLKNGMVQWMKLPRKSDGFELFIDLSLSLSLHRHPEGIDLYLCALYTCHILIIYTYLIIYYIYISLSHSLPLSLWGAKSWPQQNHKTSSVKTRHPKPPKPASSENSIKAYQMECVYIWHWSKALAEAVSQMSIDGLP